MANNSKDDYVEILIKFIAILVVIYCVGWFFLKLRLTS